MHADRTHAGNKGRRGASLIEFVLVAALFIFLLFGIMEMGFMFSNSTTVTMAAHQGARAAALGKPLADVNTAIANTTANLRNSTTSGYITTTFEQRLAPATDWSAWTPGTTPAGGTDAQVRVTVTYKYDYITGSLLGSIGNLLSGGSGASTTSRTLTGRAVMRYGG